MVGVVPIDQISKDLVYMNLLYMQLIKDKTKVLKMEFPFNNFDE